MPGQGSGCAAHGCQLQGSKPQPGRAGAAGDGWASPGDPCAQGLGGKLALHMEKLGKCSLSMFFFFFVIPLSLIQGWLGSVCKKILSSFASHLLCKNYDVGRLHSHNKYCVPCAAIKLFSL